MQQIIRILKLHTWLLIIEIFEIIISKRIYWFSFIVVEQNLEKDLNAKGLSY